ncbi:hypothetical protein PYW08_012444 [Mythimna loreyi]|uniref:Uncharacterized protein n=1 Tax=Mythimna loreyi TaxID=667449 RepID=A0ACC2Q591_9NEOP|nr:hypothetical protein PYW08_012444 [Mythimna loreyi]
MEDLLACRVCLATNVKLYDMYKYKLKNLFEIFSGIQVSPADNYPQYLCSYCCALLLKCEAFRERSRRAHELMKYAEMKSRLLTTSQIHSIAVSHRTGLPLSVSSPEGTTITEVLVKTEDPVADVIFFKEEADFSDEEPLANKVKKKDQDCILEVDLPQKEDEAELNGLDEDGMDYDGSTFNVGSDPELDLPSNDIEVICLTVEEQLKEILDRKNSYNFINSFYKCEHCFKGFIQDGTYKNHMLRHDPSHGKETCPICKTRWPTRRSLKSHTTTAHERKYICKLCGHVSKSSHRAKEHLKWHKGHKFTCKVCGAMFSKSTSHLTHLRLQHPTKFCCEVCGDSFLGEIGLNMHKKKSHRGSENVNLMPQFKCVICEQYFKTVEALNRHCDTYENGVCDGALCSCFQCGENLPTQDALRDHLKTHDVGVKCEQCNRSFAHSRSLSAHYQRAHLGHKRSSRAPHARPVSWVCEVCGKKCISNAALVYHQRTHTGEKPYQCIQCPKKFSIFQRLQIHVRTHTGERPFKCSSCPKAFKHKAALNRHDRVHSGAKPYQCGHCGKSFSQSNSMKLHVRTVHLKLPAPSRSRRGNTLDELQDGS